ncbi:MAG: hypothetical protein ACJ74Q_15140 [Pyrinomonadaceae bacterium]
MKIIRGAAAVTYARELNIFFEIDDFFLADAEGEIREERTSVADIYMLLKEQTGHSYDPAEIVPGQPVFDFLINRYGDGWIYVPQEGMDPAAEEQAALRMFRRLLGEPEAASLIDAKGLFWKYGARTSFGKTGLDSTDNLTLLYHAAVRLAEKGLLESVTDADPLPEGTAPSYGRRRFTLPPDISVTLEGALCEQCRARSGASPLKLHTECARRLSRVLSGATASAERQRPKRPYRAKQRGRPDGE